MITTETIRIVSNTILGMWQHKKCTDVSILITMVFTIGSSGEVQFTGLKSGRYILKIFAYNKLTDVATVKMVVNI